MNALVATPVLVPLATVVLTTLASRRPALQQALSLVGVLAFLGEATDDGDELRAGLSRRVDDLGQSAPFVAVQVQPREPNVSFIRHARS